MKGFKHVPAKYAADFETGTYLVGTFGFYRRLEGDRGDPLEGRVEHRVHGKFAFEHETSSADRGTRAALQKIGIELHPSFRGNITFNDCKHGNTLREQYIFCCSSEPDERYIAQGNAVFEISDLIKFAECLSDARPELLRSNNVGSVLYEERHGDLFAGRFFEPDPFKKDIKFAAEKELRIVWDGPIAAPKERIHSSVATRLVRRVT